MPLYQDTAKDYTFKLVLVDNSNQLYAIRVQKTECNHWFVKLVKQSLIGQKLWKPDYGYLSTTGLNNLWSEFHADYCKATYERCVEVLNDLGVEDY